MMPKVMRRVTWGAMALALGGVVILTTQWAFPAGHLEIQVDRPYYSRTVGDNTLFVQVDITIKNVGADFVRVDGEHFILVDDVGNRYGRDLATHFIQSHYDYLTMPPGFEFTATSIYKMPLGRRAAWMLFITATGQNAWFRLGDPSILPRSGPSSPAPASAPAVPHAAPPTGTGNAARNTGQLAQVIAEMEARSRGLSTKDLAQADQLIDLLPHMRTTCAEGASASGSALVGAANQCASEGEAVMNVIGFLRETLKSPAAEGMPGVLRHDWDNVLLQAASAVRDDLVPVWDKLGQERASGRDSAVTFHALGDVRDRIGRVLAQASSKAP
jgi:hypothetical protein